MVIWLVTLPWTTGICPHGLGTGYSRPNAVAAEPCSASANEESTEACLTRLSVATVTEICIDGGSRRAHAGVLLRSPSRPPTRRGIEASSYDS